MPDVTKKLDNKNRQPDNVGTGAVCPYCQSKDFVKRGLRQKKLESVQLYICRSPQCGRTFTAQLVKGRRYPMRLIVAGLNYYNLGWGLAETCRILQKKFELKQPVSTSALGSWVTQYSSLCRYCRLRPYALKLYKPADTVEVVNMAHRQIYRFLYHRAKTHLTINEHYKHRRFQPLQDYLAGVASETPHQYFQEGLRISEIKSKFSTAQMIIRSKQNYANELARFVLQANRENKKRHSEVQEFFIANDSVTVAAEVPVYIRKEDIEYMQNVLKFNIVDSSGTGIEVRGRAGKAKPISAAGALPRLLTGHIDLLQVRNGQIHILDYKPNAAKERPIEQLTWYALALSRLTGLRLFEFKCAWFDERDYFEFFPLHVVKKIQNRKLKRVGLKIGKVVEIPMENKYTVV